MWRIRKMSLQKMQPLSLTVDQILHKTDIFTHMIWPDLNKGNTTRKSMINGKLGWQKFCLCHELVKTIPTIPYILCESFK